MKRLKKAVRDYLDLRRSLGYKLKWMDSLLLGFCNFLKENGADHITVSLALKWAQRNQGIKTITVARRLSCIRGFARYCSANDPRTQIPPVGLFPRRFRRIQPYLYTDDEIDLLLNEAKRMRGFHGLTYYCLFGLLSVSGMRISEVCNLRHQNVDLQNGLLTVIQTKFGKSRLVPVQPSTLEMLRRYAKERDRIRSHASHFFVSRQGNTLKPPGVRAIFNRLSLRIGLRGPEINHKPRIHDLRHRFAVRTLINWYRSGQQVEQMLPALSTYLGHASTTDTYWYLSACPELMGLAINRFERHWEEQT